MKYVKCIGFIIVIAAIGMITIRCSEHFSSSSENPPFRDKIQVAREDLNILRSWLSEPMRKNSSATAALMIAKQSLLDKIDAALKLSDPEAVSLLRGECLSILSLDQGGDGSYTLSTTHSLEKVFIDEPYRGRFNKSLEIGLARNETESGQILLHSIRADIVDAVVTVAGRLTSPADAENYIPASSVKINLIGYVDTTNGKRPYTSTKPGWWPDPLLPNRVFAVKAGEVQPLLVSITTTEKTKPGVYVGRIVATVQGRKNIEIPLSVTVYNFILPNKGHYATFALGCSPNKIAKFYGGDSVGTIMDRFVKEAFRNRMPPVELISGWGWSTPKVKKKSNGDYDFTPLDHYLEIFKESGVTRFPMAIVPRFRKFGGGDYSDEFKQEFGSFVKAYSLYLKQKGMFDEAVLYNIDEASNDPKRREWELCKDIYRIVKQAAPDLPVLQCLNERNGVKALSGYADIWDLYFRQYEKSGGPERLKTGDKIMLSVCIWPAEHPNLFIEYPLLDARIMPWIAFRTGSTGFEYWEMFTSWQENNENRDWWKNSTRTGWKLAKPHGDGLLMYPGPDGTPVSSLRLESVRDGIEDYEYLVLLSRMTHNSSEARKLMNDATKKLVSGTTTYNSDPIRLLELRQKIALLIETLL